MRHDAGTAAGRGDGIGAGEIEGAQRQVERMDPGMGVGEPAGRLGEGHPREQALADGVRRRGGARIEAGERVLGIAEWAQ